MKIQEIKTKLTRQASYLKKGDQWLASYFNCSPKTIRQIKSDLREVKRSYVNSL